MQIKWMMKLVAVVLAAVAVNGCSTTSSLVDQLGGTQAVTQLAGSFLQSAAGNSQLSSLLGSANVSALTPKVADQLCSMLGGGCAAPLTDAQIKAGAAKVTPEQSSALSSAFAAGLEAVKASPAAQQAITKLVGPKLGGIVGALL